MKKNFIKDKKIRDFLYTMGANIITLITSLVMIFVVPKALSISEYGYFKIFTFYLGYIGIFHLGFNDGIYVNYGNYDYETLPREKFRAYFKFLTIFQVIVGALFCILSFVFVKDSERLTIYLFIGINIILLNITCYFEFLSQVVRKFRLYSINMVLSKIMYVVGVLGILLLDCRKATYLILFQTIVNFIIFLIYIYKYKDINFGKKTPLHTIKSDIKKNISMGFFIMLGNFVSIIIIGVDRIFVDKFFTVNDFAMYSFAVSLLSMIYIILNGIRTVIYPYLTRSDEKDLGKNYEIMKTAIFILLGYSLAAYFFCKVLVSAFLPKYVASLTVTAIIFPTILLSGEINIVTSNYYKTLKLEKSYTKNNIIAVAISLITIVIAFFGFRTQEAIATSSLLSFYLWGLYGDNFFKKRLGIKVHKHHLAEILTIVLFLVLSTKTNWYVGLALYIVGFTLIVLAFFIKEIKSLLSLRRKR
ncbi:hypothetical protein C3495_11820 [Clostridiaceae bacterium 14S0207]|nr:hypothetical protein C3495_11820 [Clostridiaceae bacterium 14S0207]